MAISTTYQQVQSKFNPNRWATFEEFESFYLTELSERGLWNYYTNKDGVEIKIPSVNHHPILKEYEVWMSGFSTMDGVGTPSFEGKFFARNFAQACHIAMCKSQLEWAKKINNPDYKEWCEPHRWAYNPNELTYWACKLCWSEELAIKFS